jgi:hypothetical protein
MAQPSTVRRFEIQLSDSDRGVYESLDLRVAQHPSESERYLVARVLVRALEHDEGVDFSRGLAASDEPALWQHDLRGDLLAWIEIGTPSTDRLHKASKLCKRVVVYAWKAPEDLAHAVKEQAIHRADAAARRARGRPRSQQPLGARDLRRLAVPERRRPIVRERRAARVGRILIRQTSARKTRSAHPPAAGRRASLPASSSQPSKRQPRPMYQSSPTRTADRAIACAEVSATSSHASSFAA